MRHMIWARIIVAPRPFAGPLIVNTPAAYRLRRILSLPFLFMLTEIRID